MNVTAVLATATGTTLYTPTDPAFRYAAEIANLDVDALPLAVVECADTAAVAAAVAASADLPLTVRGTGLSPAGLSTIDGGIVLSTRRLRGIEVDPTGATVRIGAGVSTSELDAALAPYGRTLSLSAPGEPSVVGTALFGGVGFTVGALGYTCDALLAATVVTADGSVLDVDDSSHPDLMWALRGGGGGFGVVTEATFRTWPVATLDSARAFFPRTAFRPVLEFLRRWDVPPGMTVVLMARTLPPHPGIPPEYHGEVGILVSAVSTGTGDGVAPLLALDGLLHGDRTPTRPADSHPPLPPRQFGVRTRSGWLTDLTDPMIDALVDAAATLPTGLSMLELGVLGGAVANPPLPSAAPGRDAGYLVNLMGMWVRPGDASAVAEWLAAADPELLGHGAVPAFDTSGRSAAAYGPDLARLRKVRAEYDPDGRFRRSGIVQEVSGV